VKPNQHRRLPGSVELDTFSLNPVTERVTAPVELVAHPFHLDEPESSVVQLCHERSTAATARRVRHHHGKVGEVDNEQTVGQGDQPDDRCCLIGEEGFRSRIDFFLGRSGDQLSENAGNGIVGNGTRKDPTSAQSEPSPTLKKTTTDV
jgi:hypothetical protein